MSEVIVVSRLADRLGDYPHAIAYFELILQSKEQDYSGYRQNAQGQITLLRSLFSGNPAAPN